MTDVSSNEGNGGVENEGVENEGDVNVDGRESGDLEALRTAREEGRRTLEAQLAALDDVDAKALSVLRLDVALVGVLVSALSFATASDVTEANALANPGTGAAVGLFALSATAAGLTYTTVGQRVGVGPAGIDRADSLSERAYVETLVDGYAEWIRANERANVRKAFLASLSILGAVAGTLALTVGAVAAVTGRAVVPALGAVVVFLAFVVVAGLPGQVRRWVGGGARSSGKIAPQSLEEPLPGQRAFKGSDRRD